MTGNSCGCGRSKSGFCDGSHALTEAQWVKIQEARDLDRFLNEKTDDKNRGSDNDLV